VTSCTCAQCPMSGGNRAVAQQAFPNGTVKLRLKISSAGVYLNAAGGPWQVGAETALETAQGVTGRVLAKSLVGAGR